jgi:hypothetical protein
MKENYYSQRVSAPTAFVTKGRQRVKQFNDNVIYLKSGDEFELELFNPTTTKVLAKIILNGKSIGSGLILRPGERVFLERYFDEARKFMFDTYEIDSNDPNAKKAIEENGKVDVEFYAEYVPPIYHHYHNYYYEPYPWISNPSIIWVYHSNTGGYNHANPTITSPTYSSSGTTFTTNNDNSLTSYTCCNNPVVDGNSVKSSGTEINMMRFSANFNPIETGRVEKGSTSNQSFTYDNTEFNNWYTWKTSWKILPKSQKPFVKEDLAVHCTNCGMKRKKSTHKFCPQCGIKF